MTPLAGSISDATIWSVIFDDTRSVNYDRNSFIIQAPGVNLIKLIGLNLLTLFCKLDLFIVMKQILLVFIKWSSLQESLSKFTPKCFLRLTPAGVDLIKPFGVKLLTLTLTLSVSKIFS
jgi:hypothetical protein